MPVTNQNLFAYCAQSWADVRRAVLDLCDQQSRLQGGAVLPLENKYKYLAGLKEVAQSDTEQNLRDPIYAIDQALLKFINVDSVRQFIKNPSDAEARYNLQVQLMLVAQATGNLQGYASLPYALDEFTSVLAGDGELYDDTLLVRTLSHVIAGPADNQFAPLLIKTLSKADADKTGNLNNWDDAFIETLILQTIWKSFIFLDDADQQFLLQNYFYRSIVCGVPVRLWLEQILNVNAPGINNEEISRYFSRVIENSNEYIPLDTGVGEAGKFSEVASSYLASVYNEELSALAQEKFVNGFYAGQENNVFFSDWLREALNLIYRLKKGTLSATPVIAK